MPAYTELRFHCDNEGCDFWDTYNIEDYGFHPTEEMATVWRMQCKIECHALLDGWNHYAKNVWYCPECARKKEAE